MDEGGGWAPTLRDSRGASDISVAEMNWHSFILYPDTLSGQPLFQSWNWLTLRGFIKNLNKQLAMDNPMWERLTDNAKAYLSAINN